MSDPIYRLGDVAEIVAGDPAPQDPAAFSSDGPLFVRMQDVGRNHHEPLLADSVDRLSSEWLARNRLRLFREGSTLIPKSGASVNLNHRAKLATDAYVVSHLAVVTPDRSKLDPEYLFWWSVQYDPRTQAQVTSLPSLRLSVLKQVLLRLPPLSEQRRIVVILNRAAKIERLRTQGAERLKEFVRALFVRMFGDPVVNPMGWRVKQLGEVCASAQYGTSKKALDAAGTGVPVIRMGNVTYEGDLDCAALKFVELPDTELEKHALKPGDILFNRTNSKELVGKTGVWDGRFAAVAASYFIRVRLDAVQVCPAYVWGFFNSAATKRVLYRMARGAVGQANINAREMQSLELPVPPVEMQRVFGDILGHARAIHDTSELRLRKASALTQTLMGRLLGTRRREGVGL